ncbi:hypothetical protein UFO1_1613 [Pelosinus sp. UFO1]|nr:hypothetical protein UFO1_1613 [Pelosinus sp. UFO1]
MESYNAASLAIKHLEYGGNSNKCYCRKKQEDYS